MRFFGRKISKKSLYVIERGVTIKSKAVSVLPCPPFLFKVIFETEEFTFYHAFQCIDCPFPLCQIANLKSGTRSHQQKSHSSFICKSVENAKEVFFLSTEFTKDFKSQLLESLPSELNWELDCVTYHCANSSTCVPFDKN